MESEINDGKMCAVIQSRILLPNRFVASYTPLAMANRNDSSELVMRCLSLKSMGAIKFDDDPCRRKLQSGKNLFQVNAELLV